MLKYSPFIMFCYLLFSMTDLYRGQICRGFSKFDSALDEVEHDIMNYQNQGLCYLPKPKAEADNTDTRF